MFWVTISYKYNGGIQEWKNFQVWCQPYNYSRIFQILIIRFIIKIMNNRIIHTNPQKNAHTIMKYVLLEFFPNIFLLYFLYWKILFSSVKISFQFISNIIFIVYFFEKTHGRKLYSIFFVIWEKTRKTDNKTAIERYIDIDREREKSRQPKNKRTEKL